MRISELSERSGVAVATVKYYLREGLLPAGRSVGATRAEYDETHLARLRLVRALVEAGVSVAQARRVMEALDSPPTSRHDLLGKAQYALPAPHADVEVSPEVRSLLVDLGWSVSPDAPALHSLTGAVEAARAAGVPVSPTTLRSYARATEEIARVDLASVPTDDLASALHRVVAGTVLVDPVLASLRRLAQEHFSGTG
ncbi:MerR family transcriptional regulator [Pedococcus sp. 5OH_020]|uniref:MerR family transcriptional regulator n=1 Tax=Pedococcus sp. 5OH_020 TaxID=2989814 RepID=UPI0022E9C500|nr:MerR family transcriptional regulator [Pedococcus sp. 5OH_020]